MQQRCKGLRTLSLRVMLIICLLASSGCATKQAAVVRGSSEVLILRDGDVARVPEWFVPRHLACLSPEAAEDLFRAAAKRLESVERKK